MKKLLFMALAAIMVINVMAQRTMDKLDRGLVAIKTDAGVFCSWRIFGEEYYDVKYITSFCLFSYFCRHIILAILFEAFFK